MKMTAYRQNEVTYAVLATSLLSIRLSFLYLKGEWANVMADLGFHRGVRRDTVYLRFPGLNPVRVGIDGFEPY